jgi:hypothetical protein
MLDPVIIRTGPTRPTPGPIRSSEGRSVGLPHTQLDQVANLPIEGGLSNLEGDEESLLDSGLYEGIGLRGRGLSQQQRAVTRNLSRLAVTLQVADGARSIHTHGRHAARR